MSGRDLLRRSETVTSLARRARRRRLPDGPGRAPDFVGVGVQKAGTTRWFDLIVAHPEAGPPADGAKEQHFFDRFWSEPWTDQAAADYHRAFPAADRRCLGEWTPRYSHDAWAPALLARAAPEAKVLLLLRDPVERLLSGLTHGRGRAGTGSREQAATDAFTRGLYAPQVRRLFAEIDPARVLVLQHERCVADPAGQLARTYEHLGLAPFRPDPDRLARAVYAARRPQAPISPAFLAAATEAYRADVAELAGLVPDLDVSLWPTAS